jgi:hypothetical protein
MTKWHVEGSNLKALCGSGAELIVTKEEFVVRLASERCGKCKKAIEKVSRVVETTA